jgi:hypothetical protein
MEWSMGVAQQSTQHHTLSPTEHSMGWGYALAPLSYSTLNSEHCQMESSLMLSWIKWLIRYANSAKRSSGKYFLCLKLYHESFFHANKHFYQDARA